MWLPRPTPARRPSTAIRRERRFVSMPEAVRRGCRTRPARRDLDLDKQGLVPSSVAPTTLPGACWSASARKALPGSVTSPDRAPPSRRLPPPRWSRTDLRGAEEAQRRRAFALQAQDRVDQMLQSLGPASIPSLVTWPTTMTAMPSPLASSMSRSADSRTWPTDPAGPRARPRSRSGSSLRPVRSAGPRAPGRRSGRPRSRPRPESVRRPRLPATPAGRLSAVSARPTPRRGVQDVAAGGQARGRLQQQSGLADPGSPPSSTTDRTSPPPRTRSSSEMPVGVAHGLGLAQARQDCGVAPAPGPPPVRGARALWSGSWTSVSTSRVPGSAGPALAFPAEMVAPHAWQT